MLALFIAIFIGFAIGALLPYGDRLAAWSQRLVMGAILFVVAVQGALVLWSGELSRGGLRLLGESAVMTVIMAAVTIALVEVTIRLMANREPEAAQGEPQEAATVKGGSPWLTAIAIVACLGMGGVAGKLLEPYAATLQPYSHYPLLTLLLIIGVDLGLQRKSVGRSLLAGRRYLIVPVLTIAAALIAGAICALIFPYSAASLMAGASGTGFYTLTGPLITGLEGPAVGTVVFLANLWRELSAMVLTPVFARMGAHPASAAAWGGATSMDSIMPFLHRSYGSEGVVAGLAVGVPLSSLTAVLVPLIYDIAILFNG